MCGEIRAALFIPDERASRREGTSDKFNAMGQKVCVAADKVKAPHTTALDTEPKHHAKNAVLTKESNKAL